MIRTFFHSPYIRILRPLHWVKNLIIFAPLFFARYMFDMTKIEAVALAFVTFSCAASIVYIVNDMCDEEKDRAHPKKKERPIASGAISRRVAILLASMLACLTLFIALWYVPAVLPVLGAYVALNLLYSFWLKQVIIADVLCVAMFYILRILAGGAAAGVVVSGWIVLCALFLALLITLGKRRAEFLLANRRAVLEQYSLAFLDQLILISASLTIVSYALYSVLVQKSALAVYSVLFVLLGLFRFLYVVQSSDKAEFPERLMFSDKYLLWSIVLWGAFMLVIFYHTTAVL